MSDSSEQLRIEQEQADQLAPPDVEELKARGPIVKTYRRKNPKAWTTSWQIVSEYTDNNGKIHYTEYTNVANGDEDMPVIVGSNAGPVISRTLNLEGSEIDSFLGFDFAPPPPNALFDAGLESELSPDAVRRYNNELYEFFATLFKTNANRLTSSQKSIIIMAILNYFADNGTSPNIPGRVTITVNNRDVRMKTVASLFGMDLRRWARAHGSLWYTYRMQYMYGVETRWGHNHGLVGDFAHLGADFLDTVKMTQQETRLYSIAKKRALKSSNVVTLLNDDLKPVGGSTTTAGRTVEEY